MDGKFLVHFLYRHRTDDSIKFGLGLLVSEIIDICLLNFADNARFLDPERVALVA